MRADKGCEKSVGDLQALTRRVDQGFPCGLLGLASAVRGKGLSGGHF